MAEPFPRQKPSATGRVADQLPTKEARIGVTRRYDAPEGHSPLHRFGTRRARAADEGREDGAMRDAVRRALEVQNGAALEQRIVDITTTGMRTGQALGHRGLPLEVGSDVVAGYDGCSDRSSQPLRDFLGWER